MKCKNYPYFWIDENSEDDFPYCHYIYNDGYAPCEVDEPEETQDID